MNQNKIVAFLMASIVAISIVAIATPALGGGEDKAKEMPEDYPVFREVVIVYFNEMPASLEKFASTYGVTQIFVKEDIKMAAFETEPSSMPMETSQRTLEFIEEVSKDSCVEKAYKDGSMFVYSDEVFIMPHGPEKIVERFDERYIPADLERFIPDNVFVGFWRLPPSLEEFASTYGATLKSADGLFASFETDDVPGFVKKISTDPYVMYCTPVKKPDLDESEPEVREPDTYSRDVVIVNFKEMPPSLEEFASTYGEKLIFVKEEIKFAAFETSERTPMPRPTSQRTLDFIEKVSTDPCVEKAYEDWNIFTSYPTPRYTPKVVIIYPENGLVYTKVLVRFLRLPPSLEEFAAKYGATLVEDDNLQYAIFENDYVTGFIRKISTDPYVILAMPTDLGLGYGRIADDPMESAPGVVPDGLTGPYVRPAGPNDPKWDQQWGPNTRGQRKYFAQKQGNTGKVARISRTIGEGIVGVHKEIPAVKVMNIVERRGGALYKYPQKIGGNMKK